MNHNTLHELLVCPVTRQKLTPADAALVAKLNDKIAQGILYNVAGRPVMIALDAAWVRKDGQVAYAERAGIPVLLPDEGMLLVGI